LATANDWTEGNGLRIPCRLMVDKITTVQKARIGSYVGNISTSRLFDSMKRDDKDASRQLTIPPFGTDRRLTYNELTRNDPAPAPT
jgi:hypothetical protein